MTAQPHDADSATSRWDGPATRSTSRAESRSRGLRLPPVRARAATPPPSPGRLYSTLDEFVRFALSLRASTTC